MQVRTTATRLWAMTKNWFKNLTRKQSFLLGIFAAGLALAISSPQSFSTQVLNAYLLIYGVVGLYDLVTEWKHGWLYRIVDALFLSLIVFLMWL